MGWGIHPDTMCMARARGTAKKAVGDKVDRQSLEYQKAYRAAYATQNEHNFQQGLINYLFALDNAILKLEPVKQK